MVPQTVDMKAHEASLDRMIGRSFSASFMSNSKWRRLFLALAAPQSRINQLVWKFVGRDLPVRGAAPDAECLGEAYIRDTTFSPFLYKQIEWIVIPPTNIPLGYESVPFKHQPQDLEMVERTLVNVGKFETARLPEGLKVYGYR